VRLGATWPPAESRDWDQCPDSLATKVSIDPAICDFCADHPMLYSKGRTLVAD